MLFHSTRGNDSDRKFADIVMQGLASDGGLFMPDAWPQIDIEKFKKSDSFIEDAPIFSIGVFVMICSSWIIGSASFSGTFMSIIDSLALNSCW